MCKYSNRITVDGTVLSNASGRKAARFTLVQESTNRKESLSIPVVVFNEHGRGIPWSYLKTGKQLRVVGRLRNNYYFGEGRVEILAKEIIKLEE